MRLIVVYLGSGRGSPERAIGFARQGGLLSQEDTMAAKMVNVEAIGSYFESLTDPRHSRNRKHRLVDVVVIAVCGLLCGCDGPTAIHRWATNRADWLRQFLPLPNGIPSRDCTRRLLMALNSQAFQKCFVAWIAEALPRDDTGQLRLVAIDGKTCRRSHDAGKGLGSLHLVSAWASEEGIALGQVATEEKSNEIAAIPQLLQQIDRKNTLITIDAMGCQKAIVAQIVEGKGSFVIAVKDNQPKLREAVEGHFVEQLQRDVEEIEYRHHETSDEGHGRQEERSYFLTKIPADFAVKADWPQVKAIGYAMRVTHQTDGTSQLEVRYYILNRYLSGKRFSEAVRGHWGIESMHWVLDVTFREDESRTRERTLGNNLGWLRRFAVTMLKRHPQKDSIRGKMIRCMLNTDFLTQVLTLQRV
jgi:predicted transposase YbfD/YdcC